MEAKLQIQNWVRDAKKCFQNLGMFGLPRFTLIFLFMKSKGANFA